MKCHIYHLKHEMSQIFQVVAPGSLLPAISRHGTFVYYMVLQQSAPQDGWFHTAATPNKKSKKINRTKLR